MSKKIGIKAIIAGVATASAGFLVLMIDVVTVYDNVSDCLGSNTAVCRQWINQVQLVSKVADALFILGLAMAVAGLSILIVVRKRR
jgi:hypothetical protein